MDSVDLIDPFDDCPWVKAGEIFRRLGFQPLPPEKVDDFQLRGRLWEFLYAIAARRIYLHFTDHLSDRELYGLLWGWLDHETADIPPEAEWNCRIDGTELGNGDDPTLWLRYYADDATREQWAFDFPEYEMPAHENVPYDRDRWLPEPPEPLPIVDHLSFESNEDSNGVSGSVDFDMSESQNDEIAGKPGEKMSEEWQRPIDKVRKATVLIPPDELTDDTLPAKLWELLHSLACHGFFVLHTNHLGDRELYEALWQRGIRDEAVLPGKCKTGAWFHDMIGSGSEEHTELWLRFYATDQQRAKHLKEWPDIPVPEKQKPGYDRDWRLPKGPF